jgi:uncharacterized protein
MDLKPLIDSILPDYTLDVMGRHGLPHWGRVLETGLKLAGSTGANREVVTLFAVFHDARRENDQRDPGHGKRGSKLAVELRPTHLSITDEEFDLLVYACDHHTDGLTEADVTVQTCWDADRLDLWRVGFTPKAELLCTDAAREKTMLEWSQKRSLADHVPPFVTDEWLAER